MPKSKPKKGSVQNKMREMSFGVSFMAMNLGEEDKAETEPKKTMDTNIKSDTKQRNEELEKRVKALEHEVQQLRNTTKKPSEECSQEPSPSLVDICRDLGSLKAAVEGENPCFQGIKCQLSEICLQVKALGERLEDFVQSGAGGGTVIQNIVHSSTSTNSLTGDRETRVYTPQTSTTSEVTD